MDCKKEENLSISDMDVSVSEKNRHRKTCSMGSSLLIDCENVDPVNLQKNVVIVWGGTNIDTYWRAHTFRYKRKNIF